MLEAVRAKWRLVDAVRELRHRLKMRDERISDLSEQLEAHREILDAMRIDNRLLGQAAQSDLDQIMGNGKAEQPEAGTRNLMPAPGQRPAG